MMFEINLRKIKNIKFSEREIDILSCILHLRGAKKIANILQISYRTVERHIQNIMLKISCNSQESIKDFIESSDNHLHIKKHYTSLLIDAFFQNQLLKIANHAKRKKLTFDILNQDKFKQASKKITKHLELAGLTKDCNDAKIQITIQQKESPKTSDCVLSLEKYYINFFEILTKHISDINFSNFIDEFKKLSKNTNEVRTDLTNQLVNNIQNNIDLSITKTKYKFSRKYLLIGITAACLILSGFILRYFLTDNSPSTTIISSNLHVPHASNHLERPNILKDLRKRILASNDSIKIFTLAGIAGSGKTTLARQYARASNASTIWEINCASEEEILASFEDLAQELCISTKCRDELKFIQNANTDKQRQKLLSVFISKKLSARPNWLLIFDNVETIRQIKPYLPNNPKIWGNGTIIITTRNTNNVVNNYIDENNVIILEALKPNERLNLFKKIATNTQENDSNINKFLNKIPPYPLDISIAACYLKEHNTPFADYINNIKILPLSFVDAQKNTLRDMGEYTDTRYGIITLSIHKILEKNPDFTELMLYISLINSTDIPQNMLLENHDPIITNNFIHELKKHSLIQEQHPNFLQLHKSTQQIILDFLVNKESILTNNKTTENIISNFYQFTMDSLEDENIELIRIITTHAEKLHDHSNLLNTESTALLNITLGNCYFYLRNNNKAKNFFEKGIQNIKNNIALASAQIMLGNVYTNIGEYEQAETIFKKAIQSFSQAYSPDDYHVAWSKVSLGRLYIKTGKYTNARTLLTEAYHTYKDYYGQNHPETAWVMLYLGNLLTEAGIFAEAENILSTSLNINKQHYGPKHIRTSLAMNELAHLYIQIGNFQKAQQLLQNSLEIHLQSYDKTSPNSGWILYNLGLVNSHLGNALEGINYLNQSHDIHLAYYQNDYVTQRDLIELANLYIDIGQYDKAETMLKQAIPKYIKQFGGAHHKVAQIYNYLAKLYLFKNKNDEAINYIRKSVAILKKEKHPELYIAYQYIAEYYLKNFNTENALHYIENAEKILKEHYPANSDFLTNLQILKNKLL